MTWQIVEGDCVDVMRGMDAASVDAVVCDPPYGLEFMGKDWDRLGGRPVDTRLVVEPEAAMGYQDGGGGNAFSRSRVRNGQGSDPRAQQAWHEAWAREALRVLKPGGHLLAFGGTRTYHRLVCADAGFEVRDTICWLYGSGFPKSLDVSKAIDGAAGAEREVVGSAITGAAYTRADRRNADEGFEGGQVQRDVTAPATPEAEQWSGWGTALKPAHEPIVVARKPLAGTVAGNVLEHGTGALNVDGCRVEGAVPSTIQGGQRSSGGLMNATGGERATEFTPNGGGRWPANVVLDGEAAEALDEQTIGAGTGDGIGGDAGGASRFFYVAKASRAERNAGLEGFAQRPMRWSNGEQAPGTFQREGTDKSARNPHPTVKPVGLMRWLVRLVTPPGGLVLDPFAGSASTGIGADLEGFDFIGIERQGPEWVAEHPDDDDYVAIGRARMAWWEAHPNGLERRQARGQAAEAQQVAEAGQMGLEL